MQDETIYKAQKENSVASKMSGGAVAMILGGIALLFITLSGGDVMEYLWPFFIIVPGALMLRPAYKSTIKQQSGWMFLAVPGSFFLTVGSLLFVMNMTDHFEAWAYAWTLLPSAVVAGIMYMKRFDEAHGIHEFGQKFIRVMMFAFLGFAAFFELIVFETLGPWWPLLFVGAGIYLYMRDRNS